MKEDLGPTFISLTDEDGNEFVLEYIDAIEYNGEVYEAFFPTQAEGEEDLDDEAEQELIILKVIEKDGEELLSTLDSDVEMEAVYNVFMRILTETPPDEEDDWF